MFDVVIIYCSKGIGHLICDIIRKKGNIMSQIIVIATLKLNPGNMLDSWKTLSKQISGDLEGEDGFIYRDSVVKEDGTILCILKWESRAQQEKFMEDLAARTDMITSMRMDEFERVVDVSSIKQEFLEII